MEKNYKYHYKIVLRDGSTYEYDAEYGWDGNIDNMNDTRNQFYEFDSGRFIVAKDAIVKVETTEIKAKDGKENA